MNNKEEAQTTNNNKRHHCRTNKHTITTKTKRLPIIISIRVRNIQRPLSKTKSKTKHKYFSEEEEP